MKKLVAICLTLAMLLGLCCFGGPFASAEETHVYEDAFADWNDGAPALEALIEYVEAVTDVNSPDYIPPADRIAVFDMDGTLCAELCPTYLEYYLLAWRILKDPSYTPDAEMLEFGRMLRDHALDKSFPDHMDMLHATHAAKAYAGMTIREFADFVTGCLLRDADGFEGMTWATAFYTPMIEVVDYLNDNDFKVYVCSGSDRFICRTFIEGMLDIPFEHIIGMDVELEATGQHGEDGLEYVFRAGDDVIRTDKLLIKNLKMNKVKQIVQEIGRKPVLSFGNSSGDVSMHMYTISDNPYRSAAFMLVADDDVRDYGNPEKTAPLKEKWAASGFHVISMRDDFRTIYGDNVTKTGVFHWKDMLAEETTVIEHWSEDSPAMRSIVEFVEASVDENSEGYIPKEDRIAVFDNDGTLYGERFPTYFNDWLYIQRALYDENYQAPEELKAFAQAWEDKVLRGIPIDDFDAKERELGPKLYEGLTPEEYDEVVRQFKQLPVWGFEGMTYGEGFFEPMVSLVKYLYDNDYTIYIVSATYRDAVRVLTEGVLDEYIPWDHVIGTDLLYVASGDADKDSMFYELKPEDELVIAGELFLKNQKTNKAAMIQQEIGRMPVLAFGNSTGDFSMATYTLQNEKYGGRAYMLLCDDTERDYGSLETAAGFKEKCDANGFYTVSMRDEFSTIYGDGVKMAEQRESGREAALLSEYWTEDSEAAENLNAYLRDVTDASSPDFIPVEDRVAVFDLDGTLMCETYPFCFEYMVFSDYVLNHADEMPEKVVAVAQEIADAAGKEKPAGMSTRQAAAGAVAYQGMTMSEIAEMVRSFKESEAWGFSGMTRGEAFYKPMLELFNALLENDFSVYIVTATERNIVRELINGALAIPPSHVIGTEYGYMATNQGEKADAEYTFQPSDQIVFDGSYEGENAKTSKVDAIVREIGQQPVLAFGNSSGDVAMEIYTISNNPYKSAAYMVVADDEEREYGDAAGADEKKESYTEQEIGIISMRDDFKTVYGDDVIKASSEEAGAVDFAEVFPSWNPDSAALRELVAFVSDCTDESSEGYLDPADRIATFDMDGTILCEKAPIFFDYCLTMHRVLDDPGFNATDVERDAMQQIREHAYTTGEKFKPKTLTKRDLIASAFAGMTPEEFRAYVADYADHTDVVGFEGMTYGESFYRPMIEVIHYLQANDFDVRIVSACEREVSRALVERYGIPRDHVIATDVPYVASGKGDEAANKYNMGRDEEIVLGTPLDAVSCEESEKPAAIAREIGKRPVLAFGNSAGDYSMLNYAEGNPDHEGMGFFVVCDDTVREYGSDEKAAEYCSVAEQQGWTAISMANDWATIYGDGVQKTALPGVERNTVNAYDALSETYSGETVVMSAAA